MLVKAGSKLFLAGEYAVLRENSYAIVSYIPRYTYLNIEINDKLEIVSEIEDKDNLIERVVNYTKEYFGIKENFKLNYKSQLYDINNKKYGLGSSASVIIVTIKAIMEIKNIKYSKRELFNIVSNFYIIEKISGSLADVATIVYENNILFKSSSREKRDYEIIEIDNEVNLEISAIWTAVVASSSKMISKLDINSNEFKIFSEKSNQLVLKMFENIKRNNPLNILKIVDKLNENLHYLDDNISFLIHTKEVEEKLKSYKHSKISGAGGGDFILNFKVSSLRKLCVYIFTN